MDLRQELPELFAPNFGLTLFDRGAPFVELYERGYLDALRAEDAAVLDVNREAIYYFQGQDRAPVLAALLLLSPRFAANGFVESLGFYFQCDEHRRAFVGDVAGRAELRMALAGSLALLCEKLIASGDAEGAADFNALLAGLMPDPAS